MDESIEDKSSSPRVHRINKNTSMELTSIVPSGIVPSNGSSSKYPTTATGATFITEEQDSDFSGFKKKVMPEILQQ